jgi:DNA (cytosine-5)-methyltransferase 1
MREELKSAGYLVSERRLSPHQFGIPQIRERIYIAGLRSGHKDFQWPEPEREAPHDIRHELDKYPADAGKLSDQVVRCLNVWQKFISLYPRGQFLPTHPIWSMEFGATYPYEDETPHSVGLRRLCHYRGTHGCELRSLPPSERLQGLPSYARVQQDRFPKWKVNFIRKNRQLYSQQAGWIRKWLGELASFPASLQKLEWNCKGGERDIWNYVIQFRASGVRVKRPTSSPSLVAMTTTQVPIIGWERRYMTPRECARLQGLSSLVHLPAVKTQAFKSLGNAVNADIVELIAKALLAVIPGFARGSV